MNKWVLVLGVGNTLFTDDAAGLLAVRHAASRWRGSGVDFAEAMVGGLELLDMLSGYDGAIVVDAAISGQAAPGEVYEIDPASLPALTGDGAHGAHLGTALEVAGRMGLPMPRRVVVLGIEACDLSLGEGLTPAVAAGVASATAAILRQVDDLQRALEQEVTSHA